MTKETLKKIQELTDNANEKNKKILEITIPEGEFNFICRIGSKLSVEEDSKLKEIVLDYACKAAGYRDTLEEYQEAMQTELKKKDKIIDSMCELLEDLKLSKDREGYEIMTKEDWKQYFENKVESEDKQ